MGRPDRGKQARRLAAALTKRFHLAAEVDAAHDYDKDGPVWRLSWSNGPTYKTFQAAVDALGPTLAPDVARWGLDRVVQDDALAVQAVRLAVAGEIDRGGSPSWQIEAACQRTDHPDRPADEREAAMARRLLETSEGSPRRMSELLTERGVAWLLPSQTRDPDDPAKAGEVLDERQGALEMLTAHYATGEARRLWTRQAITMPSDQAVRSALADPQADDETINAVLALLPLVRAEAEDRLAATERQAITLARERNQSWSHIGRRMGGITAQAAQQRAARRARTPPRKD